MPGIEDRASAAQAGTGGPRFGRRRYLQVLGLAGLGLAADAAPGWNTRPLRAQATPSRIPGPDANAAAADSGAGPPPLTPAQPADGERVRKWCMVIDLRHCDGCQSVGKPPQCTQSCIEGHFAPEPMQWMQVFESDLPGDGTQFVPTPCQQCQNPPCNNVCPVGATFSTPEGVVLIDQQRCIGCRMCMAACPYDRRFFNWGAPQQPAAAELSPYSPEEQTPAIRGTVMKCDFCPELARAGRLPHCAQACPQHAIYYGDLEEGVATNGQDVIDLSHFLADNSAYRLKEDLGTEPRVFYISGHGELAGRNPHVRGRLPTTWPWTTS